MITLACCTLHNFCQLQGMVEPMVCDVRTWWDPLVNFTRMCILIPWKGERAKVVGEDMWDVLFKS